MSSLKTTILKNTAWLTGSKIITNLVGYILIVAIARNLGDVGLGQYSFVFAFTGLTFILSDFGLNYLMIKEVSKNPRKGQFYFENIFSFKIILNILSLFLTILLSFFLNKDLLIIRSLWVVGIIQFFGALNSFFTYYFNAFNKMDIDSISLIIERFFALIFAFYFLITTQSLFFLVIAFLISTLIKFVYLYFKIKSKIKFRIFLDINQIKKLMIDGFPFFLTGIFVYLYFRIDTVMLSLMHGDVVTGWYNAAYKLIDVLSIIPGIVVMAILPSLSNLFKQDKRLLKILFLRSYKYLLMIIMPILIGTIILADRIIYFIYGTSFYGAILSLKILIFAEIFVFINYLMGNLLNSIDKQKYFTLITGLCALINIILNFILIPLYSYVGAGIATVITELINFILLRKYVGHFLVNIKITLSIIKILIASIIMGGFVYLFNFLAIWYIIPIGGIIYLMSLILLGLDNEDNNLLLEVINYVKSLNLFSK